MLWDRYIMRFLEEEVLNSTRGYNVQDECMKIKGISKLVTQVFTLLCCTGTIASSLPLRSFWSNAECRCGATY